MTSKTELPLISGDAHLEIDSKDWIHRVPEQDRPHIPRVVKLPDGTDAWQAEGESPTEHPKGLYGGKGKAWSPFGQTYATTPGAGPPEQRLAEEDVDGISAEILFPGGASPGNAFRQVGDDEAYKRVVRAYNTFLAKDYCATDPKRLLGVGVIPERTDVKSAIAELEYCKEAGLPLVMLSSYPNGTGVPNLDDDEFWRASLDLAMPVAVHVQIKIGERSYIRYPDAKPDVAPRLAHSVDFASEVAHSAKPAGANAVQLILSGVFDRFPDLRIFFAETGINWIPGFLEDMDKRFSRHAHWAEDLLGWKPLKYGLPSDYMKRHCYFGFQLDTAGVALRDWMAVDRLIWSHDFPHLESDWPNSAEILSKNFSSVSQEERNLMTCLNTLTFLGRVDEWKSELNLTASV